MANNPGSSETMKPMVYYDVAMRDPSSCCAVNPWKSRLALNFKAIPHSTKWIPLPEIPKVRRDELGVPPCRKFADGSDYYTLPVLVDPNTGDKVGDSLDIAIYLQKKYPGSGAGDLFPSQKLDYSVNQDLPLLVPLSDDRHEGDEYAEYSHFNTHIDAAFTAHVGLMAYTMPFHPDSAGPSKAEFVKRAGVSSWDDFEVKGETRQKTMDSFRAMLGDLAKLFTEDTSGPFILGTRATYADLIVGGWLHMSRATLPGSEWEEVRGWHGGVFGRLYDALEKYADVK